MSIIRLMPRERHLVSFASDRALQVEGKYTSVLRSATVRTQVILVAANPAALHHVS